MPGKLPIDRVRETADAPRIYELEKRRFAEQQAERDREGATGPAAAGPPPDRADGGERDQGEHPESPGPTEGRGRA